jgi:hypothetical protein
MAGYFPMDKHFAVHFTLGEGDTAIPMVCVRRADGPSHAVERALRKIARDAEALGFDKIDKLTLEGVKEVEV